MFEDRMTEDLVWIQLDLDTISHDVSTHGLIVPICHQIEVWSIDKLLDKHVLVNQKVYKFTPNQKIMQVIASMMFGCDDNKRMNKILREDNPEHSIYFGLPRWVEQSVVSDTFRALTAENISQLEMVWQDSLEVTGVIDSLRRQIESGEYITIDIDLTGDVCAVTCIRVLPRTKVRMTQPLQRDTFQIRGAKQDGKRLGHTLRALQAKFNSC